MPPISVQKISVGQRWCGRATSTRNKEVRMGTRKPDRQTRRSVLALGASAVASALSGGRVGAADYPQKPIRFVVPFTPGGGADVLARVAGRFASARLGQQIYIDNKPGAGGNISAELVAKAGADGYTLLEGNLAHAVAM